MFEGKHQAFQAHRAAGAELFGVLIQSCPAGLFGGVEEQRIRYVSRQFGAGAAG
jgi:hypothetical protein